MNFFYIYVFLNLAITLNFSNGIPDENDHRLLQLLADFTKYKEQTANEIDELAEKLKEYENQDSMASQNDLIVGFSAYKTSDQNVDSGDIISFQNAPYNYQNAYDPITGQFTCPFTAIYFVTANLERKRDVEASVFVAGLEQFSFRDTRSHVGDQFNSVTNTMLVQCDFAQIIDVRATGGGEIYGDGTERMSTFTVFKLLTDL